MQPDIENNPVTIWQKHREVLSKLKAWHDWEKPHQGSLISFLRKKLFSKRPRCPSGDELQSLAKFFFPPRGTLKASICDFGCEGMKFERQSVEIDDLNPCKEVTARAHKYTDLTLSRQSGNKSRLKCRFAGCTPIRNANGYLR